MALFSDSERQAAEALAALSYCNPFLPERIAYERVLLGDAFLGTDRSWHKHADREEERPNVILLAGRAKALADTARERLARGASVGDAERALYADTALHHLYFEYSQPLFECVLESEGGARAPESPAALFDRFQGDLAHYLRAGGGSAPAGDAAHLFACFFQLRRAFHNIYDSLIGGSAAAARLRAAVWQSIFTCDMRRYRRALHGRMRDITTLVAGPSGTGKELVARAVGLSGYVAYDPGARRFVRDFAKGLHAVNLSALSPTLIESELFGHAKGAFTGALSERAGFFELCPPDGAVFLDEIGELDPPLQVKLLRVLQSRGFQRIGETAERVFAGRVVAATNRDPAEELRAGRFRADLYYRLCSDVIVTPPLREQLEGSPEQLENLLLFLARRVAGPEEAGPLAAEVAEWIGANLPADYPWPGNVRELEQCVRNILVRRSYQPLAAPAPRPADAFLAGVRARNLAADELLAGYCTLVYAETGSYLETARRLGLDRRTVKDRVDRRMLEALGR